MFEPTSRYANLETATYTDAEGNQLAYVRRRFLPRGERQSLLVEVTVTDGDRLDLIADRTIGDPEQFWRICDGNNAMNPFDLVAEPGEQLRVTIPQVNT